ncbi:MAG: SH3 domain-containing protein [Pseudomonadota bacterium]
MGIRAVLIGLVVACLAGFAAAQDVRGRETNLQIPRFVSVKASEANARRGPGLSHRIDWVFKQRHLPLQVTGEYGHWRRVRDVEGAGGWVHYSLLSGARYVLVTGGAAALRKAPDPASAVVARAEAGALARLGACRPDWCRITAGGVGGWVPKIELWGVDAKEVRN